MRESRSYGSVRGVASNGRPYRDTVLMNVRDHRAAAKKL